MSRIPHTPQEKEMYPSPENVEKADKHRLCYWSRFLPSPKNDQELQTLNRILARIQELGGWTPEISKAIGWGQ